MTHSVTFLYLQQEDVIACGGLDMRQIIEAVEEVYTLHEQGMSIEPEAPLITWNGPQSRRILVHPAWVGGNINIAGVKWIPSNPENPRKRGMPRASAIIILNDPETGHPLVVMDGTLISAVRTGAATGIGAKYLARPESIKAAIIGAGPISRPQIMALREVLPALHEVSLFDIDLTRSQKLAEEMRRQYEEIEFNIARSAETCVRDADVVVTATSGVSLDHAYLEAKWLKEGVFISTVASNDAKPEVVAQADKLVLTNIEELENETWLVGWAVNQGIRSKEEFISMGSIILGQKTGRESERERIFYNPGGMGIEDIAAAFRVFKNARDRGVGVELELWREPAWI